MATNNEDLIEAYDKMTKQVMDAYAAAREALVANDLVTAQSILARIAQSHAKSSVSLRSILIRRGLLQEDKE